MRWRRRDRLILGQRSPFLSAGPLNPPSPSSGRNPRFTKSDLSPVSLISDSGTNYPRPSNTPSPGNKKGRIAPALKLWISACRLRHCVHVGPSDRNLRANLCAAIEVKHVLVIHTDASVRNLLANQLRRVRSMNSIHRFTEVKCAHTEGIPWIAACDVSRKPWIFAAHISRWRPGWVFPLLAHIADARPFGFSLWDR